MSLTPKDIVNGIIALDAIFIGLLGALLFFEPNLDLWTLFFVSLSILCFFMAINSIFVDLFIFKERDIPRDVTGLSFIGFLLTAITLASFCFSKYPDSSGAAWMFLAVPGGTAAGVIVILCYRFLLWLKRNISSKDSLIFTKYFWKNRKKK